MSGKWTPEYPGQEREPVWVWWHRDEPEDDLLGFHTKDDRDRFSRGGLGPFRRRLCWPGSEPIPQNEDWRGMIDRLTNRG